MHVLSSRLDLADFENKRLRERFSTMQEQLVLMKEEGIQGTQPEVTNKSITRTKHVGIQVESGFNSEKDGIEMDLTEHYLTSTLSPSVDQSEVRSLNSSKRKEQTPDCQFFEDLLLGGWGFDPRSSGGELSNLPSSLTVTPALCSAPANTRCSKC